MPLQANAIAASPPNWPAQAEPCAAAVDDAVGTWSHPDGQTLTIRAVTEADVEGLDALFEGLSDEDRHHRFFNLCHPARTFLEQMTRAEDEGGYRLVAVASGAKDSLAAEAGYAILPDGDGEFALTVAPGWRGRGLGSYLLVALVAAAAARGVPNLQADIMLDNAQMLALVRHRGYITLHRDEFSDTRIAIGAAQPARRRQRGNSDRLRPVDGACRAGSRQVQKRETVELIAAGAADPGA